MALSGTVLAALIRSKIAAIPVAERDHEGMWNAIGDAIVEHIKAAGVVVVASVSGVTTGAGTSGPGTGTIT